MAEGTAVETGTRARTRRAILDAAMTTLLADPAASLGDIAAAAGVGRTTMHRYFPERTDLLDAISSDVLGKVHEATTRACVDEGPAPAALARLCQEYFELGTGLQLLFVMPEFHQREEWEEETTDDRTLLTLVDRGRNDGDIDPALPAAWVQTMLWSTLYSAWDQIRTTGMPKHEALSLAMKTLDKLIAPNDRAGH